MKSRSLTAVLVLAVILPLVLVWLIVTYFETNFSRDRAKSANLTSARIIARLVNKTFDDTFHHIGGHKSELAEAINAGKQKEINHALKEILFSSPSMSGIALYDERGNGVAHLLLPGKMGHKSIYCPKAPGMNWSNESWYTDFERAGQISMVTNIFRPPCNPKERNTAVVVPVEEGTRTLGLIRATFDVESIDRWFKPLKFPAGVRFTLLDGRRKIVFDSQSKDSPKTGQEQSIEPSLASKLRSNNNFIETYTPKESGTTEIIASVPIAGHTWTALVRQPLSVVDNPVKTQMIRFTAALACLLVLELVLVNTASRSYSRERQLSKELAIINDITLEITRGLDIDNIIGRIAKSAARLLGSESSAISLIGKSGSPSSMVVYNLPKECAKELQKHPGFIKGTTARAEPLIFDDYPSSEGSLLPLVNAGVKTLALVPIIISGEPLGSLACISLSRSGRTYSNHDLELLRSVANQAGIALENARLYEAQRSVADTLQETLLTVPDTVSGLTFGHLYRSATESTKVGGDFYDIFELEHGRVGLIIGDVSGKGLEAAALTSFIKDTIRAYAYEHRDIPGVVLGKTNTAFLKNIPDSSAFVTVFFGIMDTGNGILTYANAGHTAPVFKQNDLVSLLPLPSSPAIGILADANFNEHSANFNTDDILVLYTDGITESRREKELFGEARLIDLVRQLDGSVENLVTSIFDEVNTFSDGTLRDDIAILAFSLSGSIDEVPPVAKTKL